MDYRIRRFVFYTFLTILALLLLGVGNYTVFYEEIMTRFTGEGMIDWEKIAAICGWTGLPGPGESEWVSRLRGSWNMISSRMAMTGLALILMFLFFGFLHVVFRFTGKRD